MRLVRLGSPENAVLKGENHPAKGGKETWDNVCEQWGESGRMGVSSLATSLIPKDWEKNHQPSP